MAGNTEKSRKVKALAATAGKQTAITEVTTITEEATVDGTTEIREVATTVVTTETTTTTIMTEATTTEEIIMAITSS